MNERVLEFIVAVGPRLLPGLGKPGFKLFNFRLARKSAPGIVTGASDDADYHGGDKRMGYGNS